MTPRRQWLKTWSVIIGFVVVGLISTHFGHFTYKEPERLTPDQIRQRRVLTELERQRRSLEANPARLSPANRFHLNQLKEFEVKFGSELEARRQRAKKLSEDSSRSSLVKSLAKKAAIAEYLQLRSHYVTLQQRAASEKRRRKFQSLDAAGRPGDFFDPNYVGRTIFGTEPWIKMSTASRVAKRMYHSPGLVFDPCVKRDVRRQVMFAKGHAGRGFHTPKRLVPTSVIGC